MAIWVISANPLFGETISQALADRVDSELRLASPEEALRCIHAEPGEVLLVDDAVPPGTLKRILKRAQGLSPTRLILLNSTDNDYIVLDSYQVQSGQVDDLVRSIQTSESARSPGKSCHAVVGTRHDR
jgi:hypothetical protein